MSESCIVAPYNGAGILSYLFNLSSYITEGNDFKEHEFILTTIEIYIKGSKINKVGTVLCVKS